MSTKQPESHGELVDLLEDTGSKLVDSLTKSTTKLLKAFAKWLG